MPEQEPKLPPHRCGRCESRWWGLNMCHCSACHLTFGGIKVFDKHQVNGKCLDVATDKWFFESRPGVWSAAAKNGREKAALSPKASK